MSMAEVIERILPGEPMAMAFVDVSTREDRHKVLARQRQAEHYSHTTGCAQCQGNVKGEDSLCDTGRRLAAASHSVSDPEPAFFVLARLRRYYHFSSDSQKHDSKLDRFERNPVFAWRAVDVCVEWAIPFPAWVAAFLVLAREPGRVRTTLITPRRRQDARTLELAVELASEVFTWEWWEDHREVRTLSAGRKACAQRLQDIGASTDLAGRIGGVGRALVVAWAMQADRPTAQS